MSKRKLSSAIAYSPGDYAPILLAKGRDREALQIITIAEQEGIAVIEDCGLAALLDSSVKPGELIPPWCWEAAARILALVLKEENFG